MHVAKHGKKSTGGLWLDATIEQAKLFKNDEIVIVNIEENPKLTYLEDENVKYYTLSGKRNSSYSYRSNGTIREWRTLIEKELPDIIEIWGTEFPFGLAAIEASEGFNIPFVVFVQGILESIARYYCGGLSSKELRSAISLRDILMRTSITQMQKKYYFQSAYESEIIKKSGSIIIENEWSESYYQRILPGIKSYRMPISIADSFKKYKWSEEGMVPHTIMCPEAYYPIKGLHILLKAIAIVKHSIPDVKLTIPGYVITKPNGLKGKLKQKGYDKLILKMIDDLQLTQNVNYIGRLTADEMGKKMIESNCFVMCSAIENHSATLKEAMTTGAPCLASYVGGVPEYATHGNNCLMHRFEDYEMLAYNIIKIFNDSELRNKLSRNAIKTMQMFDESPSGYSEMRNIFSHCINARLNC